MERKNVPIPAVSPTTDIQDTETYIYTWGGMVYNTYMNHMCGFLFVLAGSYFITPKIIDYIPIANTPIKFAFLAGTYAVFSSMVCTAFGNLSMSLSGQTPTPTPGTNPNSVTNNY